MRRGDSGPRSKSHIACRTVLYERLGGICPFVGAECTQFAIGTGPFRMKRVECPRCGEFHALNVVHLPWYLKLLAPFLAHIECRECRERFLVRRKLV